MSDQHPHTGTVPDYDILNTRNNSSIFNEALGRTASRSVQARNSFFYASAFKQLHSLQQKQVGLLVGVAVADAALKPLDELSSMNALGQLIAEGEANGIGGEGVDTSQKTSSRRQFEDSSMRPNLRLIKDEMTPVSDEGILDSCIFATPASIRRANKYCPVSPTTTPPVLDETPTEDSGAPQPPGDTTAPTKKEKKQRAPPTTPEFLKTLAHSHSYPYSLNFQYIQRYTSERHAPSLAKVAALWSQAAQAQSGEYTPFHGELPIVTACCALLATPATYAWADRQRLNEYTSPFVDCLLEELSNNLLSSSKVPPGEVGGDQGVGEEKEGMSQEETLRVAKGSTQAFLLLIQKSLQHNPSPVVNTLHCVPDPLVRQLIFADKALAAVGDCRNDAAMVQLRRGPLGHDGAILRLATDIVHRAPTYKEGILMVTRAAAASATTNPTPLPMRAIPSLGMLVGACLGAKFGVQHIPTEWIMATPDHSTACSSAMEVANWSWNNPSRLKQGTI